MLSFKSKFEHSEDTKKRIINGYHQNLALDVMTVLDIIPKAKHDPSVEDIGPVKIENAELHIPYRVYFPEPNKKELSGLSENQAIILASLYTRHNDGYVREKWLHTIIDNDSVLVVPFIIQLFGEYVIEIIQFIYSEIENIKKLSFKRFIAENCEFCELTSRRALSYWSCYFRWETYRFKEHCAYKALKEIGVWCDNIAPRVVKR